LACSPATNRHRSTSAEHHLIVAHDVTNAGSDRAQLTAMSRKARKVMQIENDYDKKVYNGDIGYIVDVDPAAGELAATFDGRSVTYGFGELDTLVPAYAANIHKSQGSEYPAVVIPVLTQHHAMLQRNLLYTGVTRGKRLVVLVGQKKAIAIAVRNVSGRRRWSKLDEWLRLDAWLATSRRKRDEARWQRSKTAIRHILSLRRG
jgi:ATP-dependent exoDNAse (exonuclease V) alpha subunit